MKSAIAFGLLAALVFSTIAYAGNCTTICNRSGNTVFCHQVCY